MPDKYWLSEGSHANPADGRCAMEWVSYLAGEPHTDEPVCVSPVLKTFCISVNDALDDEQRQRLRPYLARTIGTAGDGLDEKRAAMCLDWLVRVYTPAWLELVPSLRGHAAALREMPEGLVVENTARAMETIRAAQKDAVAAGAAAWAASGGAAGDAARDAAWAAAWDAAGVAARAASGDAAWAASGGAAGDAARDAAWAAARDAAGAAARAASGDAARAASGDAAWAASGGAAGDAAGDALKPTVKVLQDSALELLDAMLPTEVVQLPVVAGYEAFVPVA